MMLFKSVIRLNGVARNPANGFPARLLGWAEEVEVYELYNLGLADGLISLTEKVIVYGRYDLGLVDHAVVVGVVPANQILGFGHVRWRAFTDGVDR